MTPPLDIASIANARLRAARANFKQWGGEMAAEAVRRAFLDVQWVQTVAADLARDAGGVVDLGADASTERRGTC